MSEITVGQYLFLEDWKPLGEALESAPSLKVETLEGNPQDVVTFLSGERSVLLFVSLGSKDDLIALANLVKMSKKVLKDVPYKIIVTNFTGNKNIEKAILKMGIMDILEDGIKPKALRFKIDFWVKSLAHTLKSKPQNLVKKELKAAENNQDDKKETGPHWIEALDEEADIWLVKNELEIKKILGRWLVKVMGPSPHVSSWVEVEGQRGVWKYQVKETHSGILLLTEGTWYYRGDNKPEYNWKDHLWTMAGDKIELFYQKNKIVTPRFFVKDKVLQIAKNSDYAKTKQELILETFGQEHIFKKENEANDDLKGVDTTDDLGGNLKGKSSTDQLASAPLSGKTKTGSDQFSDLSGKGKTDNLDFPSLGLELEKEGQSGNLSGAVKTDSVKTRYENETKSSRPIVQSEEEKKQKEYEERNQSDLSGKSETSRSDGFYKNKTNNDVEAAEEKEKDRKGFSEKSESGQAGAKGKQQYNSNNLDQEQDKNPVEKYYKEHNEATQYDAKDLSGKGVRADEISGHMSSIQKASNAQAEKEEASRNTNSGLLARNEDKNKNEAELSAKNGNSPEKKAKSLEGQTDKTPYERADDQRRESGLSGKGSRADELSGHMSSKDSDKNKENKLSHPSTNLEALGLGENKKDRRDQSAQESSKKASSSASVYPIRPKVDEEIGFQVEEEAEILSEGESPLSEITQNAKVFSFITQGSIKRLCDLDDYFDDMVILRVSGGDFMELQPVQLDLSFHYQKEKTPIKVAGVIEVVDADESNYFYVTVRLREEQVKQFDSFISLYQKRQNHIDQFMKRAKGL